MTWVRTAVAAGLKPGVAGNVISPGSQAAGDGWRWRRRRGGEATATSETLSITGRSPKAARVEAALFVSPEAMPARKLVQVATLADVREAWELVDQLNRAYDAGGSAFRIEHVAAGFQMLTRPVLSAWLDRAHERPARMKLSSPQLETLTVIAYRQPCTRADVEAIRGVQSAELIKQLMERQLVKVIGEDQSLGRPFLYGTTRQFLELFGLARLDDLPDCGGLRESAATLRRPMEADTKLRSA